MATARDEPAARPLSEALRSAIAGSGLSHWAIAFRSGVHVTAIVHFVRGDGRISLASADKLSAVLNLELVGWSRQGDEPAARPLSEALRSAIAGSGLSFYALAIKAGVTTKDVRPFALGKRGLLLTSADRLVDALGIKVAIGAASHLTAAAPAKSETPGPIAEALRSAIAGSGLIVNRLARDAGVHTQSVYRFVRFESDLSLASVDRLLGLLGLQATRELDGIAPGKLSDAIRSAIAGSGRSWRKLGEESSVMPASIGHFMRGDGDMKLATAERLCAALGIGVTSGPVSQPPGPRPARSGVPGPIAEALRSAIAGSGLSFYALAKRSGVSSATISQFLGGRRDVSAATAAMLSQAIGLKSVGVVRAAGPVAAARCPVELRGEGSPILVYGDPVPALTGIPYQLLAFAVDRFDQGGVCLGRELAGRTTSTSNRPIQSLTMKLREPRFGPLARVVKWDARKGGTLRIIDPGPLP